MEGVSVVICCYNSLKRIAPTLLHLQDQKVKNVQWEVVLVDNGSTDGTAEESQRLWNLNPVTTFRIVNKPEPGQMAARLEGLKQATYDIVSFIDDDNWVEPLWIEKVWSIMKGDSSLAGCGGVIEGVFETTPPEWINDFASAYAIGKQKSSSGYVGKEKDFLWGAGLTVRRQALNDLFSSGFTTQLRGRAGKSLTSGDDSELCFALRLTGWNLWYDESLKMKHFIPVQRLTTDYLYKVYKGFGKAEVVLSIYRSEVRDENSYKKQWWLQCLASLKRLSLSFVQYIAPPERRKLKSSIQWKHDKAYIFELILNRKKFYSVQQQVAHLKSIAKNNNN